MRVDARIFDSATTGFSIPAPLARAAEMSARGTSTNRASSASETTPSRATICSTPGASFAGYATPARGRSSKRIGLARSETKNPLTSSAGCVAHHPTTPTFFPAADAMFHTAGTARESPDTGSFAPLLGSTSWKSRMRWTSGPTPVARVPQTTGDSTGKKLRRSAVKPSEARRAQLGIFPSRERRSTISQSSPSSPSQITGGDPPAGRGDRAASSASSTGVTATAPLRAEGAADGAAFWSFLRQAATEKPIASAQRSPARLRRMVKTGKLPARRLGRGRRRFPPRRKLVPQVGLEELRLRRDEIAFVQERRSPRKAEPHGQADVAEDPPPRAPARQLGLELLFCAGGLGNVGGELPRRRRGRPFPREERVLVLRVESRVQVCEGGAVLRGRERPVVDFGEREESHLHGSAPLDDGLLHLGRANAAPLALEVDELGDVEAALCRTDAGTLRQQAAAHRLRVRGEGVELSEQQRGAVFGDEASDRDDGIFRVTDRDRDRKEALARALLELHLHRQSVCLRERSLDRGDVLRGIERSLRHGTNEIVEDLADEELVLRAVHQNDVRLLVSFRFAVALDPVALVAGKADFARVFHGDDGVRVPRVPAAEEVDQAIARLFVGDRGGRGGKRQKSRQKGDFSHGAHVNTRLPAGISGPPVK